MDFSSALAEQRHSIQTWLVSNTGSHSTTGFPKFISVKKISMFRSKITTVFCLNNASTVLLNDI